MKKTYITIALIGGLACCLLSNSAGVGTAAGVNATTGAGCSCHSPSAAAATTVSIQLLSGTTPVTTYTPGGSYTVRVTGTNTGTTSLPRFGYQLTATKTSSASTNAGSLTAPAGSHTVTASGVRIAEQSAALAATTGTGGSGTTYVVNVPWTAPIAGTGGVTFRSVVNAINNNGGADAGDRWNSASLAVTEAVSSSVPNVTTVAKLSVFPNPNNGTFSLSLPGTANAPAYIVVTNVAGQKVKEYMLDGMPAAPLSASLLPGLYHVTVSTVEGRHTTAMIVE